VQARASSPKPAEPSPSRQSHGQGLTGLRAWALSLVSLRPQLQALVCIKAYFQWLEGFKIFLTILYCFLVVVLVKFSLNYGKET
jgi:uncharacterized membrane protein